MVGRRWPVILAVIGVVCLGGYFVRGALAVDGVKALDLVILIDNSSGVDDPGRDEGNLRIRAVKFLIDYLQAISEPLGLDIQIGIANFSRGVTRTISLRPINDHMKDFF